MCRQSECATLPTIHDPFEDYCSDHKEVPGAMEGVKVDIELHSHGGIDRTYVENLLVRLHEVVNTYKEPGSIEWKFMR